MEDYLTRVERWLESKGVTLWSTWNIQDPVQRQAAAVWFVSQQDEFDRWDTRTEHQLTSASWDVV